MKLIIFYRNLISKLIVLNEFEEVAEELLAKNIINIEEIEPFKPLLEKLKDETFVKYLDEVL